MFNSLPNCLLMIIVLISFAGQSMAYHVATTHDELSNIPTQVQQKILVKSSESANNSADNDDCCEIDCCPGECICPANTCSSHAYFIATMSLSELVILSELQMSLATQDTYFLATSLYRPPIFFS